MTSGSVKPKSPFPCNVGGGGTGRADVVAVVSAEYEDTPPPGPSDLMRLVYVVWPEPCVLIARNRTRQSTHFDIGSRGPRPAARDEINRIRIGDGLRQVDLLGPAATAWRLEGGTSVAIGTLPSRHNRIGREAVVVLSAHSIHDRQSLLVTVGINKGCSREGTAPTSVNPFPSF